MARFVFSVDFTLTGETLPAAQIVNELEVAVSHFRQDAVNPGEHGEYLNRSTGARVTWTASERER